MNPIEIKAFLKKSILSELNERIDQDRRLILECQESANSDTKSSAGDKYETNRAMMHLAQEQYSAQLEENLRLYEYVQKIVITNQDRVSIGSLVETSIGTFFIAISSDDIEIDDEDYTPISIDSPLGTSLKGYVSGDIVPFRETKITIFSIA